MEQQKSLESLSSDVIAANVEMYREVARNYDHCFQRAFGEVVYTTLERDLDVIASRFASEEGPIDCLDCGAGTGALTLGMLARGWRVTAVDVSPDMSKLLEKKIASQNLHATLVNEPIENFLAHAAATYHLIGFNSVLHHIYDYRSVVSLAVDRLKPGGILYSNVDPVSPSHPLASEIFDSVDTLLAKLMNERVDLIPGTVRRLRKLFAATDRTFGRKVLTAGDIAEFHARSGIDDLGLMRLLQARGMVILEHSRYPMSRVPLTEPFNKFFKLRMEFKFIAERS